MFTNFQNFDVAERGGWRKYHEREAKAASGMMRP